MICWRHSNSVNTGSRLQRNSDVKTRKRRNVVGIDMIRNNRKCLCFFINKYRYITQILGFRRIRILQLSVHKYFVISMLEFLIDNINCLLWWDTVSAGRRHTNGYELCPSSNRFIFILIWVGVSLKACKR